jgi:hypothetical protein
MTRRIDDLGQYGHTQRLRELGTAAFNGGHFKSCIQGDRLVRRSAYTAAKRTARALAKGKGQILPAKETGARWHDKGQTYLDSSRARITSSNRDQRGRPLISREKRRRPIPRYPPSRSKRRALPS